MGHSTLTSLGLLLAVACLAATGAWGSLAAYVGVAGLVGVLCLRMPERHSKALGVASFIFAVAHILRAFYGVQAYETTLSFGYVFCAYAGYLVFRGSCRRIEWSSVLEVGALGTALATAMLFTPFLDISSTKQTIVILSVFCVLTVLMSDLGRRSTQIVPFYLAAIFIATWMEVLGDFLPDDQFSAFWTAPYYPLIAGCLLPEAARKITPTYMPARRNFGLLQVVLFAGATGVSVLTAYLNQAMPALWAALAMLATVLVFARISLLIRQRDWSFAQERELRQFGENLIAHTSVEEINDATVVVLERLVGNPSRVAILDSGPGEQITAVAKAGLVPTQRRGRRSPFRLGSPISPVDDWFDNQARGGTLVAVQVPTEIAPNRWFVAETTRYLNQDTEVHFKAAAAQYSLALRSQELTSRVRHQEAQLAAEQARREAQQAWQALSVGSQEVALRVNEGLISDSTPHAVQILGVDPTGGRKADFAVLQQGTGDGSTFENPARPGQWLKMSSQLVADGSEVITIRDVTLEVVDASTDSVTGFRLQSDLEDLGSAPGRALHLIHFGGLDKIRERLGRPPTDQAIRVLAARTQLAFRADEDCFWRVEDGIIVATTHLLNVMQLEARRHRIGALIATEAYEADPDVTIATLATDAAVSPATAVQSLRIALGHGLRTGSSVVRFDDELYAKIKRSWDLERAFKQALVNPLDGGFSVHYQPLVSAKPHARAVGVEALARWTHPELGSISPAEFIPVAEDMGLIDAIDDFVLHQALRDLDTFHEIDPEFMVHVNLSPAGSLANKLDAIRKVVLLHGSAKCSSLVVEITESALGDDPHHELVRAATDLRALGIGLAVDDFGTGESNYDRITTLPFNEVKLSSRFADTDEVVVSSIVQNFHALGLTVVAENVETSEQLERLREASCDVIQGYYYHRPAPVAVIVDWIANRDSAKEAGASHAAPFVPHQLTR